MEEIRSYTMHHEPHRDCRCSARVLDAVDDYIVRGHAGLKRKPLNLVRKWKLRRQLHYYPLLEKFRRRYKISAAPTGRHSRLWMPFPGRMFPAGAQWPALAGTGFFTSGLGVRV